MRYVKLGDAAGAEVTSLLVVVGATCWQGNASCLAPAISSKEAWIRMVALRRYHRPPGPRVQPGQAYACD